MRDTHNLLHGPLLNSPCYVCLSLVLGSPELHTVLPSLGGNYPLPSCCPPDNISNAAQDTISCLLCKGMLLAHIQCAVHQELRSFSVKLLFSQVFLSMY